MVLSSLPEKVIRESLFMRGVDRSTDKTVDLASYKLSDLQWNGIEDLLSPSSEIKNCAIRIAALFPR